MAKWILKATFCQLNYVILLISRKNINFSLQWIQQEHLLINVIIYRTKNKWQGIEGYGIVTSTKLQRSTLVKAIEPEADILNSLIHITEQ